MWDRDVKEGCVWIIVLLVILAISIFLGPLFFMLCWNYALCAVFVAIPTVTYWQSFGLCFLLGIVGSKFYSTSWNKKID